MVKGNSNILKNSFFEEGGISQNAFFILFVVFLMIIQIGISFKNEEIIIRTRQADYNRFNEGMKSISLKIDLMNWYKRSVIEKKVKGSGLQSSDKLPYVIEKD